MTAREEILKRADAIFYQKRLSPVQARQFALECLEGRELSVPARELLELVKKHMAGEVPDDVLAKARRQLPNRLPTDYYNTMAPEEYAEASLGWAVVHAARDFRESGSEDILYQVILHVAQSVGESAWCARVAEAHATTTVMESERIYNAAEVLEKEATSVMEKALVEKLRRLAMKE